VEQADNFLSTLSIRGANSSILGFVVPRGKPRYVKGKDPIWQPRVLAKTFIFSLETLIGTIIDLLKFTHRPVEEAKVFKMALRQKSYLASACIISNVSSAY
jgi:hypothetical protein